MRRLRYLPAVDMRALTCAFALCVMATLVHFAHNAEYLKLYPNLPPSWTRLEIYTAWGCSTLVGVVGLLLYRYGLHILGTVLLLLYALVGLDGLLHYTRAPMHEHSATMNFTILVEAAASAWLLFTVGRLAIIGGGRDSR